MEGFPLPTMITAVLCLLLIGATSADPVVVFRHGERGYPCIRVPSIVRTNSSLLAFAGTRCGAGDGCFPAGNVGKTLDHMDLVMKRSADGGRTWSDLRVLYSTTCDNRDHGTPAYDAVTGRVLLVTRGDNTLTWSLHSDDDGHTWSTPARVPLGPYNTTRPAPGTGLQLRAGGPRAGRLLFLAQLGSGAEADKGNVVYWTDDGGDTWAHAMNIVPGGQEAQVAQLSNGTLLLNARRGLEKGHEYDRLFATSADGGASWAPGVRRGGSLAATSCMGSFLASRYRAVGGASRTRLLYSHPASFTERSNGTVWVSEDEGATFTPRFQVSPANHSVPFAYSCLTETHKESKYGLLFETGADDCSGPSCRIMFTTLSL